MPKHATEHTVTDTDTSNTQHQQIGADEFEQRLLQLEQQATAAELQQETQQQQQPHTD